MTQTDPLSDRLEREPLKTARYKAAVAILRKFSRGPWNPIAVYPILDELLTAALTERPEEVCPATDEGLTPLPHEYRCIYCGEDLAPRGPQ